MLRRILTIKISLVILLLTLNLPGLQLELISSNNSKTLEINQLTAAVSHKFFLDNEQSVYRMEEGREGMSEEMRK